MRETLLPSFAQDTKVTSDGALGGVPVIMFPSTDVEAPFPVLATAFNETTL
jgi:hypothetical protein